MVDELRMTIFKFCLFLTRFMGRGITYVFLGCMICGNLWDNAVAPFLGTHWIVFLSFCTMIMRRKLMDIERSAISLRSKVSSSSVHCLRLAFGQLFTERAYRTSWTWSHIYCCKYWWWTFRRDLSVPISDPFCYSPCLGHTLREVWSSSSVVFLSQQRSFTVSGTQLNRRWFMRG